jgi:hypothetical protein
MANLTEQQIDEFIQFINDTEEPESVTNSIVAAVLAFIANKIKTMASSEDIASVLNTIAAYFSDGKLKESVLPETLIDLLETFVTRESTTPLIKLDHSRFVLLDSMGSILDGQEYTPVTGDLVLRSGHYIWRWNGTGWDNDGAPLREHVLYVNKLTGKTYRLENGSLVETIISGSEGGDSGVRIWVGTTDTTNDTLFIRTSDSPYIMVTPSSYDFGDVAIGGVSKQKYFTIKGKNLTGSSISVSISGAGFSVVTDPIPVTDGAVNGARIISFYPTGNLGTRTGKLTLTCGEVTAEVALSGTAVEQVVPIVEFDPSSLSFSAVEGSKQTKTLAVSGRNLEGDVTLTSNDAAFELSLDGSTFNSSVTLPQTSGSLERTVYVRYTAGSSSVTGKTITATSTNMSAVTVGLSGTLAQRLADGSYFTKNGLKYTVLTDNSTVMVQQVSASETFAATNGAVNIPATINDSDADTEYDADEGTMVNTRSGLDYSVVEVGELAFYNNNNVTSIIVPEGVTTIGGCAFRMGSSGGALRSISLPSTLTTFTLTTGTNPALPTANLLFPFYQCKLNDFVIPNSITEIPDNLCNTMDIASVDGKIEIGNAVTSIYKGSFMPKTSMAGKKFICHTVTPPTFKGGGPTDNLKAATLYVPAGSKTPYQNASGWLDFASIVEITD